MRTDEESSEVGAWDGFLLVLLFGETRKFHRWNPGCKFAFMREKGVAEEGDN